MAKAFSEEDKEQIKIRIMETALDLFHDKGTKSLSIQELTKRVGIAQGSFYSFWKEGRTGFGRDAFPCTAKARSFRAAFPGLSAGSCRILNGNHLCEFHGSHA